MTIIGRLSSLAFLPVFCLGLSACGGGPEATPDGEELDLPEGPADEDEEDQPVGPAPNENSDEDGYCYDPESGYFPCDDGAPPGSSDDPEANNPGAGDGDGDSGDGDSGDGDGDGDGPGGDGDGPGGDGDVTCTDETFSTVPDERAQVLLVVDKSGSMDDDAVGYPGSKWDGAVDALSSVVSSTEEEIDYGLMLYPDGGANFNVCQEGAVEVGVGPSRADDIVFELGQAEPGGGTPTAASLLEAKDELDDLGGEGPKAVIVATDGAPNCNLDLDEDTCTCTNGPVCDDARNCLDDDGTLAAAQQLNAAGYAVFVIGIPGSEDFTGVLNGLAEAGGTAQAGDPAYYQADDSGGLSEALADIVTRIATCRFDLASPPEASTIEVTIGGNTVPQDPTRTNGWDLVDVDTIELFGASCNLALGGDVDVQAGYCYAADG